jgi:hypothetical protein
MIWRFFRKLFDGNFKLFDSKRVDGSGPWEVGKSTRQISKSAGKFQKPLLKLKKV